MPQLTSHQAAVRDCDKQAVAPAILSVLSSSPPALFATQGLYTGVAQGKLEPRTCERIAIALAQLQGSANSLAIHTKRGSNAGLTGDEMRANQAGTSHDARAAIAVELACALSASAGRISDGQLARARAAGYDDTQLVDIITLVCLSSLENMLDHVAGLASMQGAAS